MGLRRGVELVWGVGCVAALSAGLYLSSCGKSEPESRVAAPAAPAQGGPAEIEAAHKPETPPRGPAGWHAVYAGSGATSEESIKTLSPYAAFVLGEGETPHPGVAPAGLTASFAGEVTIEKPGKYRFAAVTKGGAADVHVYSGSRALGSGALTPDQTAVDTGWIDAPAGVVSVSVTFRRNGSGASSLRTVWQKAGTGDQGFLEEPIGPDHVTVARQGINDAAHGRSAMRGRVLIGELNCIACHEAGGATGAISARTAPYMGEIGRRASADWLKKWVLDPHAIRPGAVMPAVFGPSAEDAAEADAIVHFLLSLGNVPEWQAAGTESQIMAEGARLYHSVGCVACHGVLDDPERVFGETLPPIEEKTEPLLRFGKLSGKWRPAGLAEFLVDPTRTHPSGRMPSMALSKSEADLIASYLVTNWDPAGFQPAAFEPDPAKVEIGKTAFAARGCASCHQVGHQLADVKSTLTARPLAEVGSGGCLDGSAAGGRVPRYALSDEDRTDIEAGLAELKRIGSAAPAPIDASHRLIEALNCRACHEINESGGVAPDLRSCFRTVDDADLGDEGRFPPRLTGVGMKLTTPYLTSVLTKAARARPYMQTRMPQFGAVVSELPSALAKMEGVSPGSDVRPPMVTDAMVIAGRTLVGENGMNCISCHVYGGKMAGTQGPDIRGFAESLRYEWWKPYLMNPTRFKPMTRMTAFYHYPGGKGQVTSIHGGDFDRQADALWAYFAAKSGPEPEGLPSASGLPLVVGAKPEVFRTFLKEAGSRGIAVGYPIGVHFGFDATAVKLVSAWRGAFIDATSTWKGRGGQTASGQGQTIWKAPPGPAMVIGTRPVTWPEKTGREGGYEFLGYKLDDKGVPTFLYKVGECEVEEVFEPVEKGNIRRVFTVRGVPEGSSVWVNTGPGVLNSEVLENVAEDRVAGDDRMRLEAYTPREPGIVMHFALTMRTEVK